VDRRSIRREIIQLKEELEKITKHHENYISQRKKSKLPLIALVGYTNSGKSTLLNTLAHSEVLVEDKLFATLDPTTRRVDLSPQVTVLMTDTVGFIQKLPATLIAAFHATLKEITEADLLVHVVDISHINAMNQAEVVNTTLSEIGAKDIPVILALNKIDNLSKISDANDVLTKYPGAVAISALTGEGIDTLKETLYGMLFESYEKIHLQLPYKEGQLISLFYRYGKIKQIDHTKDCVIIKGEIPGRYSSLFVPWKKR
jgi:GTP-binding protein HflX